MSSNKQSKAAAKTPATATSTAPAGKDPRGSDTPETDSDDEVKPRSRARVKDEPVDEMVTVKAPKPFKLTVAGQNEPIDYQSGIYEMPRSHAEHWYAKHFGVEIAD